MTEPKRKIRRSPMAPDLPSGFWGESAFIGFLAAVCCFMVVALVLVAWTLLMKAPWVLVAIGFFFIVGAVIRWRWNPMKG